MALASPRDRSALTRNRRKPPGPAPIYDADQERAMMIAAAYEALACADSGSVSVSGILTDCGLSTRSFYRHFRSKDELLLAMFNAEVDRMTNRLDKADSRTNSPPAALEAWIDKFLSATVEPKNVRRTMVMASADVRQAAGYADAQARMLRHHRTSLRRILERGAADGSFPRTDPIGDAAAIQDLLLGLLLRKRDGIDDVDVPEARCRVLRFVRRAVGLIE